MFLCYAVWSMCSLWLLLMFGCRCPKQQPDDEEEEDEYDTVLSRHSYSSHSSQRTLFVPDHVLPPDRPLSKQNLGRRPLHQRIIRVERSADNPNITNVWLDEH